MQLINSLINFPCPAEDGCRPTQAIPPVRSYFLVITHASAVGHIRSHLMTPPGHGDLAGCITRDERLTNVIDVIHMTWMGSGLIQLAIGLSRAPIKIISVIIECANQVIPDGGLVGFINCDQLRANVG